MKSAKNKIHKNEIYNFPVNYTTKTYGGMKKELNVKK
jgi:putative lipoic acid-binding regulatory protein